MIESVNKTKVNVSINRPAQGAPGQDGYTPVRGVDYWTPEDKSEVVQEATAALNLSDYATKEDLENVQVDLTDYYNKEEVDNKIPDTSAFVTESRVEEMIEEIPSGGAGVYIGTDEPTDDSTLWLDPTGDTAYQNICPVSLTIVPESGIYYVGSKLRKPQATVTYSNGATKDVTSQLEYAIDTITENTQIELKYVERGIEVQALYEAIAKEPCSWATGTDEEVAAMIQDAQAGNVDLSQYWRIGESRKISIESEIPWGLGSNSYGRAGIHNFVIVDWDYYDTEDGKKTCAVFQDYGAVCSCYYYGGIGLDALIAVMKDDISFFPEWLQPLMKTIKTKRMGAAGPVDYTGKIMLPSAMSIAASPANTNIPVNLQPAFYDNLMSKYKLNEMIQGNLCGVYYYNTTGVLDTNNPDHVATSDHSESGLNACIYYGLSNIGSQKSANTTSTSTSYSLYVKMIFAV